MNIYDTQMNIFKITGQNLWGFPKGPCDKHLKSDKSFSTPETPGISFLLSSLENPSNHPSLLGLARGPSFIPGYLAILVDIPPSE